ncbi:MAG: response regulator [Desulfovibrionaceae bacterium]
MDRIKMLLVDDEQEFVETLAERLRLRELGPEVALDGERALQLVQDEIPDVMVLDLKMPGIDGMEVLRRVRAKYPAVQVVILTGHGSDKDRDEVMRLGAYAYLQKPVEIDELVSVVHDAYAHRPQEATA